MNRILIFSLLIGMSMMLWTGCAGPAPKGPDPSQALYEDSEFKSSYDLPGISKKPDGSPERAAWIKRLQAIDPTLEDASTPFRDDRFTESLDDGMRSLRENR